MFRLHRPAHCPDASLRRLGNAGPGEAASPIRLPSLLLLPSRFAVWRASTCSRPLHTCTRVRSHESTHAQVLSVEVALQRPGADKEVRANLFASAPQCRSVIQPSPAPLAPLLLGPHIFKYNGNGCRPCLRSGARCVRSWRTCSCRKKSGRCWPARCRLSCTASAPWCPPATRLVLCLPPPVHLLSPTRC